MAFCDLAHKFHKYMFPSMFLSSCGGEFDVFPNSALNIPLSSREKPGECLLRTESTISYFVKYIIIQMIHDITYKTLYMLSDT